MFVGLVIHTGSVMLGTEAHAHIYAAKPEEHWHPEMDMQTSNH